MPPAGSEEAKLIYTSLFLAADMDSSGFVDKEEFKELLRSLFKGIQLQLEERPIMVDASCLNRVRRAGRLLFVALVISPHTCP